MKTCIHEKNWVINTWHQWKDVEGEIDGRFCPLLVGLEVVPQVIGVVEVPGRLLAVEEVCDEARQSNCPRFELVFPSAKTFQFTVSRRERRKGDRF